MKIVITSQGPDLNSPVDPRFGRAAFFLVYDTESEKFSVADNKQNLNAPQGAGIQAGRTVVELGAEALITGHVGPKAFTTLQAGKVSIYTGATGTVAEAINRFRANQLSRLDRPDVEGHWV